MKPAKNNPILQKAAQLRDENRSELVNMEAFTKALNRKPAVTKTNKFANNTQYVPISHIQTLLDQMFFGCWQTKNFNYKVVGNEICGSVDLWLYHPVLKEWIVRTGAAATQIRQNRGAKISDIDQKIKNALEMDVPHLLADCVKSAAKTLGSAFGRDLNRDFVDDYKALVSKHVQSQTYTLDDVRLQLDSVENALQLTELWERNPIWQSDKDVETLFNEKQKDLQDERF